MARILSIIAIIMQCTISPHRLWAVVNTGHTTNNGGGLGELILTDLNAHLARYLAPCLTPANLCELELQQIMQIRALLAAHSRALVEISSSRLYSPDGAPLARVQILNLVLQSLSDCAGLLSSAAAVIAERALSVVYHREFSGLRTVTLVTPEKLILAEAAQQTDLTQILRSRLRAQASLQIAGITTTLVGETLDITGVVQLGPMERYHFQFRVLGSNRDLMVYP